MKSAAKLSTILVKHGIKIDTAEYAKYISAYGGRELPRPGSGNGVAPNNLEIACGIFGSGRHHTPAQVSARFAESSFTAPNYFSEPMVAHMMNHGASAVASGSGYLMEATADVLQLLSKVQDQEVDPVVETNRKLLLDRSRTGIEKYRTTLADSGLTHRQLLQHLLEELLDAANYTQAILSGLHARKVLVHRLVTPAGPHAWNAGDMDAEFTKYAAERGWTIERAYE